MYHLLRTCHEHMEATMKLAATECLLPDFLKLVGHIETDIQT